ncbi:MAG: TonB-dependent receptor family protein [Sediminibacterium sp.]
MKKLLSLLSLVFLVSFASAQSVATVKGILIDSLNKQSLKDASIVVLAASDSSLEVFTLAKADGSFIINNAPFGEMLVQVKFQGYEPFSKKITFSAKNSSVDLGKIYLQTAANDLGNVTVTQSPVQMKKDTVEFTASAFKTKPNAVAEDLLKKIPGIQVDKDGGIKAQGETVQRVLVDGKRFFGDDPKMATRNLPPDIIDKIQVFDAASDQSAFTGFDDGNRVKTINITTRKDKRKGYFGRAALGAGANSDDALYDNNINISKFNGDQQITFTGQANNVNKQNFSVQDMLGSLGGGGFGGGGGGRGGGGGATMGGGGGLLGTGGGGGIVKTLAAGLNYKDNWGTKTQFSGSYFYNDQITNRDQNSLTENLVTGSTDSSIFSKQVQSSVTNNKNHRINFNIETNFDTSNTLIIRPNISFQNTHSETFQTTSSTRGKITSLNSSRVNSTRDNQGINGSLEATFRHRFAKRGRTYSIGLNSSYNTNDGTGSNWSQNQYNLPSRSYTDTLDQIYTTNRDGKNNSATLSYTEPIGKNKQLEFNYNISSNVNNSGRATNGYNKVTDNYDIAVPNLSNIFENTFNANRFTLNYRIQNAKYNFSVGSGLQVGDLVSKNISTNVNLKQHFVNLFPSANFRYDFTKSKNLRMFYNGRTSQPSADQLQPVIDNSNPLLIRTGNPNLKQQFSHSFRFLFNSFDIFTQKIIFATLSGSFIENDIQNSTTISGGGVQTIKPVNLSGTYNVNGFFNYGFPIKKPKSNLNLMANVSRSQTQTLVNSISNFTRNTNLGGTVSWTTNIKEGFDMNFSSNSNLTMARYTLQPQQNGDFFSQTVSTEATIYSKSGWVLSTDFDYIYNAGRSEGFNTSIPLWNASLSKQMLKNKAGELKFYVFDLLNQNISISRNVTSNYIQDLQTRVLKRYFMISFTYNLRKFGATQGPQNPMMKMMQMPGAERQMNNMMRTFRGGGM